MLMDNGYNPDEGSGFLQKSYCIRFVTIIFNTKSEYFALSPMVKDSICNYRLKKF